MSDPMDFPPPRALPDSVRDLARRELAEGMADTRRPSRRTPLVIAAAVVLLAATGAVVAEGSRGGTAELAVGPTSAPSPPPQLPPPDPAAMFHARDGWAPADVVDRCAAVAGDLPPKQQWRPITTTVVHATTLTVFSSGGEDGMFFCETTPSSVTVSAPAVPDTGGAVAKIHFISPNGSVGGFVRTPVEQLMLQPIGPGRLSAHALVVGDIFLAPQGFRDVENGVTFVVDGEREHQSVDVPRPSTPTVDRPQPPGDRTSEEGRGLGACLDGSQRYVPTPANWQPGAHAVLSDTSEVQLGRSGDLLAVCRVREQDQPLPDVFVVDRSDISGKDAPGDRLDGTFIWGTGYFYDFRTDQDGASSSSTKGFVGRVADDRVASITLTRNGFPDATAVIKDGTFVLAGPAAKGMATVPPGVEVIVRDARGSVLEELSPAG